jgi:hypothetical protein
MTLELSFTIVKCLLLQATGVFGKKINDEKVNAHKAPVAG